MPSCPSIVITHRHRPPRGGNQQADAGGTSSASLLHCSTPSQCARSNPIDRRAALHSPQLCGPDAHRARSGTVYFGALLLTPPAPHLASIPARIALLKLARKRDRERERDRERCELTSGPCSLVLGSHVHSSHLSLPFESSDRVILDAVHLVESLR